MDDLSAWFVLAAEYCNDITNPSTEIFDIFQIFFQHPISAYGTGILFRR
jgi:hypothetical protein